MANALVRPLEDSPIMRVIAPGVNDRAVAICFHGGFFLSQREAICRWLSQNLKHEQFILVDSPLRLYAPLDPSRHPLICPIAEKIRELGVMVFGHHNFTPHWLFPLILERDQLRAEQFNVARGFLLASEGDKPPLRAAWETAQARIQQLEVEIVEEMGHCPQADLRSHLVAASNTLQMFSRTAPTIAIFDYSEPYLLGQHGQLRDTLIASESRLMEPTGYFDDDPEVQAVAETMFDLGQEVVEDKLNNQPE